MKQNNYYMHPIIRGAMFIFLIITIFVMMPCSVQAQVASWTFAGSTGTYTAIAGGTLIDQVVGSNTMDDNTYSMPFGTIPFLWNGYSAFYVQTNGWMAFGGTSPATSYTPISGTSTNDMIISALGSDLQGLVDAGNLGEMRCTTLGIAPNRTFVVQWKNFRHYGSTGENYNFQIRLNENNTFAIVYGSFTIITSSTVQVGMRGTTNVDFNNRTTATDWTATTAGVTNADACTLSSTIYPPSGYNFAWTPPTIPAQTYASSTTTQNTLPVLRNSTNNHIIGIQVVMSGSGTPLALTQFNLNTNGTTNVADISNAKIFCTGYSNSFSPTIQFGSTVPSPSGSFTITGSQTLFNGTNYFWLSYDIPAGATVNNLADAECPQITVGGVGQIPTITAPPGSRLIRDLLSGIYTIDQLGSGATNYTSFTAAFNDLNGLGIGGPVTFNVAAGQTFSENPPMLTATGTASRPIVFQKTAGANPIISSTGTVGTADYIIALLGSDYITFDGLTFQDAGTAIEYGIIFLKQSSTNGCQFNTIKNCTIAMNKANTSSRGIYLYYYDQTLVTTVVPTSLSGTNSFNKFYGNTITNFGSYGMYMYGYPASVPYSLYDQNNEIGVTAGNSFTDFGATATTHYGIYSAYNNNLKVANNSIIGGTGATAAIYGMYFSTATNANLDVYNNTVTLTTSTSNYCLYVSGFGGTGNSNIVSYYNNTFTGCTTTAGAMYGIYTSTNPNQLNIYGNNIFSNIATSTMYPIYQASSPFNYNCYNNNIYSNTTGAAALYCIYTTTVYNILNMYNNQVYGNTNTSTFYGIYMSPTISTIGKAYNNKVYNNTCNAAGTMYGMYFSSGQTWDVYNNQLYGLKVDAGASTGGTLYGLYEGSSSPATSIYNNFISDLTVPKGSASPSIYGMYLATTAGGPITKVYHNTIYLNATSTYTLFGTAGIYASTSGFLDLRNNIVVNNSTQIGTGRTMAYYRSSTTLTSYLPTSGNNCFYAGTPGTYNNIYFDGTNADQTMTVYKTRVSPRDQQSFSEVPPFVNVGTVPYDLHINPLTATACEAGGQVIAAVTQDIDGNIRCPNGGCAGGKLYPDVGADEFNGIAATDLIPPQITYIPFGNGPVATTRTFSNVTITDPSGVNGTTGTRPRCYYKKSTDANDNTGWKYVEATGSTSPFTFNIDYSLLNATSVTAGDIIQYFVVAQDQALTPNVGMNAGGFAAIPSSVALTSAAYPIGGTINQYTIIANAFCGPYNIGTGQTYTTLKAFIDAVNAGVVTCNITANIISDLTETATVQINQMNVDPPEATWTLTIQPSGARTISGAISGALINFYSADNIIIDGLNTGGNSLTLANNTTGYYTLYFTNSGAGYNPGTTNNIIRNCTINGASNTVACYAVYMTGADHDNITFQRNTFARATYGLYLSGSSAGFMDNMIVNQNTFGGATPTDAISVYGIYMTYNNNMQITNNDFANMQGSNTYLSTFYCIYMSSYSFNPLVSRNKFHNAYNYGLGTAGSTAYGCVGMYLASVAIFNPVIANNMLYDFKANNYYNSVTGNELGMYIAGGTNIKIYNNTIYFSGPTLPNGTWGCISIPIYISGFQGLDIRNNIFANTMTSGVAGVSHTNYAIYQGGGGPITTINNNNYYAAGPGAMMAYGGGAFIPDLPTWIAYTGQDQSSWAADPLFVSGTDPHIASGATQNPMESGAVTLPEITNDIDNESRPGPTPSVNGGKLAPDIGADEFDGAPNIIISGAIPTTLCAGIPLNIPFTIGAAFLSTNTFIAQLSNASGSFSSPIIIGTLNGTTSGTISANIPLSTAAGTGYRIRIVGSAPSYIGPNNGSDITINPFYMSPATIPGGNIGCNYNQTFTLNCGTAPITWTETGTLPAGILWNAATATLSGTPSVTGTFPITVGATDANSNTASINYSLVINPSPITILPAALPVVQIGLAYSQTFTQTGGTGTITWSESGALPTGLTWDAPTATISGTAAAGTAGLYPITITVTTSTGCTQSKNYILSVGINCTLTCPSDISVNNTPGVCGATVTFPLPGTSGTCGTVTCTPPSGSLFPVGVTTVVCLASVGVNCTFNVTVTDNQAPTITCPAPITRPTDAGVCTAVVTFSATATDNCAVTSLTCSPPSGSTFAKGTTTVTCTAKDAASNTSSCSFNVTVVDQQKPSITCPANKVQSTDPNLCTAVVNWNAPVVTDNCPGPYTTVCVPPSGSVFPKGVTTVTCTATDASGNTQPCSFTVQVNDTQKPTITCPANLTIESDAGCTGSIATFPLPTIWDNCPGATVSTFPSSGSYFNLGITTVTGTATDASGNTNTCTFTVTVIKRPVITLSSNPMFFRFGCKSNIAYTKDIIVTNTGGHSGGGVLQWTASTSASEITLVTSSGNEGDLLKIKINPTGLAFGNYTRTITITGKNSATNAPACNSPVTLTVNIEVEPDVAGSQTRTVNTTGFTDFTNSYGQVMASIKSNTTNGDMTVNWYPCTYPNGMSRLRYLKTYWTISSQIVSRNFDVTFYYSNSEMINITKPSAITLWQQPVVGGAWTNLGGTADTIKNSVTKTGITSITGVFDGAHLWVPKRMDINIINAFYDRSSRHSVLQWTSNVRPNSEGFFVERSTRADADMAEWETVGNVAFNSLGDYGFSEKLTEENSYWYRIYATDEDGIQYESDPIMIVAGAAPIEFALEQNYPNPFNPSTLIRFALAENTHASLKVYDVFMREVMILVDEERGAGHHEVMFDASNLPSGVYYYRLSAGSYIQTRKMNLMK